ncbi:unnamed protein product [Ranitomeya imitator]|uniref:Non-specific serine/threonine protein kinase n=1 Tax=Ranitomeya imitator TaxID=111125 RepID=A0ABN9M5Q2_9NEOB|nr:unnamed protein product [Ranitomeya imitator]
MDSLFAILDGVRRGLPASKATIARSIRTAILGAYRVKNRVPPPEIKAHSTRAVGASSAVRHRAFADSFAKRQPGLPSTCFRRTTADSSLGRRILQAAVQEHTDSLRSLRFTLAFAHSVMEIASLKGGSADVSASVTSEYQMQESVVADQISLLSREWSYAEQLVLYLKAAELLSNGLQTAMEQVKSGKLCLSSTVKQVVKKLNDLYKSCVSSCHCLNVRLQRFFADKQKLMDRINSITAEKLIFSYTVQMVQSAALDEMFHHREDCVQRYHKALLLMDGLLNFMTEHGDIENINKYKLCIERRLFALQGSICA